MIAPRTGDERTSSRPPVSSCTLSLAPSSAWRPRDRRSVLGPEAWRLNEFVEECAAWKRLASQIRSRPRWRSTRGQTSEAAEAEASLQRRSARQAARSTPAHSPPPGQPIRRRRVSDSYSERARIPAESSHGRCDRRLRTRLRSSASLGSRFPSDAERGWRSQPTLAPRSASPPTALDGRLRSAAPAVQLPRIAARRGAHRRSGALHGARRYLCRCRPATRGCAVAPYDSGDDVRMLGWVLLAVGLAGAMPLTTLRLVAEG